MGTCRRLLEQMVKRVIEAVEDTDGPVASPAAKDLKTTAWRLAADLPVEAGTTASRIDNHACLEVKTASLRPQARRSLKRFRRE
jgi:hypothetical protein